jgi:hypothetical protein
MFGETLTAKVFRPAGTDGFYYGRIYVPQGGKWRVAKTPAKGVQAGVYRAYIDGADIYLSRLDSQGGYYWIDATETSHSLIVRSTSPADIIFESVSAADDAAMQAEGYYYFDKSESKKNKLATALETVLNANLAKTFNLDKRCLYVMANPAKYGLAFIQLDPTASSVDLAKNSLYITGKKVSASRLNIIFTDDMEEPVEATAIKDVKTSGTQQSDNAVYSLQGIRTAQPQKGHLYIKNGKKFVQQ